MRASILTRMADRAFVLMFDEQSAYIFPSGAKSIELTEVKTIPGIAVAVAVVSTLTLFNEIAASECLISRRITIKAIFIVLLAIGN